MSLLIPIVVCMSYENTCYGYYEKSREILSERCAADPSQWSMRKGEENTKCVQSGYHQRLYVGPHEHTHHWYWPTGANIGLAGKILLTITTSKSLCADCCPVRAFVWPKAFSCRQQKSGASLCLHKCVWLVGPPKGTLLRNNRRQHLGAHNAHCNEH